MTRSNGQLASWPTAPPCCPSAPPQRVPGKTRQATLEHKAPVQCPQCIAPLPPTCLHRHNAVLGALLARHLHVHRRAATQNGQSRGNLAADADAKAKASVGQACSVPRHSGAATGGVTACKQVLAHRHPAFGSTERGPAGPRSSPAGGDVWRVPPSQQVPHRPEEGPVAPPPPLAPQLGLVHLLGVAGRGPGRALKSQLGRSLSAFRHPML